MAAVTHRGNLVHTVGALPELRTIAPDFSVTGSDLGEITGTSLRGKKVILNIFPSVDTAVCATSVRRFNEVAGGLDNTVVLCVSADLPFAQRRFCGTEGLTNVRTGSCFRSNFGESYGVTLTDGLFGGLLARAVVVLDESGVVVHTQLVPDISNEPDYQAALDAVG